MGRKKKYETKQQLTIAKKEWRKKHYYKKQKYYQEQRMLRYWKNKSLEEKMS
jgi:hypothetical protein